MQRRTSKLSRIALAIAVSLASRSTGANPAEHRVKLLSPSAPLSRTAVHYGGTQGAWAPTASIGSPSLTALPTLIVPRVALESTHVLTSDVLERAVSLIRGPEPTPSQPPDAGAPIPKLPPDAVPPIPRPTRDALAPIHVLPRAPGLSDPEIMNGFITRAPAPRVTVELSTDGTGILFYIDHGVGIPIRLAGKPTDEHAARNFAAVAHDRRLSFPRSLQIDAEYGVDAELADGRHLHYTDDAIRALVPPEHVLRMKPSSRRVAAR